MICTDENEIEWPISEIFAASHFPEVSLPEPSGSRAFVLFWRNFPFLLRLSAAGNTYIGVIDSTLKSRVEREQSRTLGK